MNTQSPGRPSKNERRQAAREQARLAREAEKKREKRNRLLLQGGVAAAIIAVLVIAAIAITNALRPAQPAVGPANMASGGAVFVEDLKVAETAALKANKAFVPTPEKTAEGSVHVRVFVDFICPACGSFEDTYGAMLEQYTGAGDVTLEIHPLNFLDTASAGTKYSTRAANLFACAVDQQPDKAYALFKKLFEEQPKEGTTGHSNEQLLEFAAEAGVQKTDELTACVQNTTYAGFIDRFTQQVLQKEVLGLAEGATLLDDVRKGTLQNADQPQTLRSTPTVIVNGQQWYQPRDGDLEQYILKLKQGMDSAEVEGGTDGSTGTDG